jgi:hypothetical protein
MEKVRLVDICNPKQWKTIPTSELLDEGYPVYGANGIIGYYSEFNHENPVVAVTCRGATCGSINITVPQAYVTGNAMCLDDVRNDIEIEYLYYCLKHYNFNNVISGSAQPQITRQGMEKIVLSIFNHDEQVDIISKLKKTENVIGLRKQELAALDDLIKARFVEMFGDAVDNPLRWNKKQLQEIVTDDCTISYGIVQTGEDQKDGVPVFRPVDIVNRIPKLEELKKTTEKISNKYKKTILKGREMLITVRANIAETCIVGEEFKGCNVGRGIVPIRTKEDIMVLEFLKYILDSKHINDDIKRKAKGITLIQLNMQDLREIELIIPPIEKQKAYVQFAKQVDKSKFES